jgi:hypothetical protein
LRKEEICHQNTFSKRFKKKTSRRAPFVEFAPVPFGVAAAFYYVAPKRSRPRSRRRSKNDAGKAVENAKIAALFT